MYDDQNERYEKLINKTGLYVSHPCADIMRKCLYDKFDGKHYFYFDFRKFLGFLMGRDVNDHFLKNWKNFHRAFY